MVPKVKIQATKLENATANFISLVDRGANRIPFKIIKRDKQQEQGMINLDRILKGAPDQAQPTVVGLVVEKGADFEQVTAAVKSAGYVVNKQESCDDGKTVMFKQQDDVDIAECTVVKMSDDLLLVLKGFDPYSTISGMSFTDCLKAQGFLPSVGMAFDALRTTMYDTLMSAEQGSNKDVVNKIQSSLSEFSGYVVDQAKMIPAQAFKADAGVQQARKGANNLKTRGQDQTAEITDEFGVDEAKETPANQGGVETDQGPDTTLADGSDAGKPGKKKPPKGVQMENQSPAGGDQAPGLKTKAAACDTDDDEDDGKKKKMMKADDERLEHMISGMSTLTKAVSDLSVLVQGVVTKNAEIQKSVVKAETDSAAALKTVKGTVLGGDAGGDRPSNIAQKTDNVTGGNFDTAFTRNVRKAALGTAKVTSSA